MSDSPATDSPAGVASPAHRRTFLGIGAGLIALGVAVLVWVLIAPCGTPTAVLTVPTATPTATWSGPPSTAPSTGGEASASPSPDSTDGAGPAAPVTAPPPQADGGPVIESFAVSSTTVECRDERSVPVPLSFSWAAEGASRAWIGVGTTDASAQPFAEVAPTASGYTDLQYPCGAPQQLFTLTVASDRGTVSRTIVVTRQLE